jgi:regulator of protease activity HflC (stomatin/prohibitin superfamily)
MLWFFLTIILLIGVGIGWFFIPRIKPTPPVSRSRQAASRRASLYGTEDEPSAVVEPAPAPKYGPYKTHGRIGAAVCLGLWLLVTAAMSVETVEAGEVGVVRQFGEITSQIDEGVNFIAPWQSVDMVNVRTQRHTFGTVEDPITAASSETQDVYVIATINYGVSEGNVQELIREVGSNWFDILVPTRVNQYIKQETAKYPTAEIIPNRETIRQAVLTRLQGDLGENYSITVSDFLIDNISFSTEYLQAIEDKQVATEQAQAAANRTAIVSAEAEQARVRAQGAADAVEIAAQGQADANALIDESLTPELLQWQAIQELNDNVDIMLVPSDQGLILNLPTPTTAP